MLSPLHDVRSIVCDLDGTLYKSDGLANEIQEVTAALVAQSRGLSLREGKALLRGARKQLTELLEEEPTLTRTCLELGIEVAEFHRALQVGVRPERYLDVDPVLVALLESLESEWDLYLYTNNSLPLARKIVALLGIETFFKRLYTIEFNWTSKPDPETLEMVLEDIGGPPESFLFVGDRDQVDLKVPRTFGIPTLLVNETADLLQIHKLLGVIP